MKPIRSRGTFQRNSGPSRRIGPMGRRFRIPIFVLVQLVFAAGIFGQHLDNNWRCQPAPNPDMTYILVPNSDFVTLGARFKTNELGLRDGPIIPKTKGVFRILCLGDSVTFGTGVKNEQTYPNLLEAMLQPLAAPGVTIDVINAGISAYNVRNIRGLLQEYIDDLKPDVVVYAFVENDLDDSVSVAPGGLLIAYDPATKSPEEPFIADDYPAVFLMRYNAVRRQGLLGKMAALLDNQRTTVQDTPPPLLIGNHPETRRRWNYFSQELARMKELCQSVGAPLFVFSFGLRNHSEPVVKRVDEISRQQGLPHASTLPVFEYSTYMSRYSLGYDPHLNLPGHTLMAQRLLCFLLDNRAFPETLFSTPPNHNHSEESHDPAVIRRLEEQALAAPRVIDIEKGKGVLGMIGGVAVDGKMARYSVFRLAGPGNEIRVTCTGLFATPEQPQSLTAEVEGELVGPPVPIPAEEVTVSFPIPPRFQNQRIEVKLIAGGPVWTPPPQDRYMGATAQTLVLKRVERLENGKVEPQS